MFPGPELPDRGRFFKRFSGDEERGRICFAGNSLFVVAISQAGRGSSFSVAVVFAKCKCLQYVDKLPYCIPVAGCSGQTQYLIRLSKRKTFWMTKTDEEKRCKIL